MEYIKCYFTKLGNIRPSIESIRSLREGGVLLRYFPQCSNLHFKRGFKKFQTNEFKSALCRFILLQNNYCYLGSNNLYEDKVNRKKTGISLPGRIKIAVPARQGINQISFKGSPNNLLTYKRQTGVRNAHFLRQHWKDDNN